MADVDLANQALNMVGDDAITTLGDTTRRAVLTNRIFDQIRQATLQAHPWREALVYDILYAYTEPTGTLTPGSGATVVDTTGVTFTASVAVPFTTTHSTDGWRLWGDGVAGKATITGFTSTTVVTATIDEAFAGTTAIATGSWRLYTPAPAHTYDFMIARPSAMLRAWKINEDLGTFSTGISPFTEPFGRYARVGDYLFTSDDQIDVEYIQDLATTSFGPLLIEAFVHHLAYRIAIPLAKKGSLRDELKAMYKETLQEARTATDQEATPEEFESNDLIDVRF
jgi:hypothetical protein